MPQRRSSDGARHRRAVGFVRRNANVLLGAALVAVATVCIVTAIGLRSNTAADQRRAYNSAVQAKTACERSYLLGPAFLEGFKRAGILGPADLKIYRESIPEGKSLREACP